MHSRFPARSHCLAIAGLVLLGCSAPEVASDKPGQELAPESDAEKLANVPVRAGDAPKVAAAPAAPVWPKPSIGTATPSDVSGPPADAQKLATGLSFKILKTAEGPMATRDSKVVVHYAGWTTKGELFDSSVPRGQPLNIGLWQVIEGWRDGVAGMKVGEVRRLWIPEALAYKGQPGTPQGMLVFDVELLGIE